MGKKVKIYESEIKRAVRRGFMEKYLMEDYEMKDTYSTAKYKQSPREAEIEDVFGEYGEDIPRSVLRYMRKNPQKIIKRLYDVYGQQMFDYISQKLQTPELDIQSSEEMMIDEQEKETIEKITYSKSDVDQARNSGVGINVDGTVTPTKDGGLEVTKSMSESDDWIQGAIKEPGSLSKELGVPEEDDIPSSLINKEIDKLKEKDKDPKKKGIQGLSKGNLSKLRRLNLAKTLKKI